MANEVEKIGSVEGLGDIYESQPLPADKQLVAFIEKGINRYASPGEVTRTRIASISTKSSRTSMAPIAVRGANTILYRFSPLMNPLMIQRAVNLHRKGEYLAIPGAYEEAEAIARQEEGLEPEDRTAIILPQKGDFPLTPETEATRFILERPAKQYFEIFGHTKIPLLDLSTDSEVPIINYLWFGRPEGGSFVSLRYRGLYGDDVAFGVLPTGVASAKKFGYDLTQIRDANLEAIHAVLRNIGVHALEEMLTKPLTDGLLKELRK